MLYVCVLVLFVMDYLCIGKCSQCSVCMYYRSLLRSISNVLYVGMLVILDMWVFPMLCMYVLSLNRPAIPKIE